MATEPEIDEIYDAVEALMDEGCFGFLNEHLFHLTPMVWRMDIDILLAYATATLVEKNKLPAREGFLNQCRKMHPGRKLWDGL
jgi:hypothetical protein